MNGLIEQWGYSTIAGYNNLINYYIKFNYIIHKSYSNRYYGTTEFFGITESTLTSLEKIGMESSVSTSRSWYWNTIGY